MISPKAGIAFPPPRLSLLSFFRRGISLCLVLLLSLSLASAETTENELPLPDSLFGQRFINRGSNEGISLQIGEDGSFELSTWQSENRGDISLNIYRAEFYGRFNSISKIDGCLIYELSISGIDKAGAMIYDVYYPPSEDVNRFAEYFPWEPGTSVRIVPPQETGGLCLIGTPDTQGKYSYREFIPLG